MPDHASTQAPGTPRRGWFKRNWKWFVPAILLGPLVRASNLKSSKPYRMTLEIVQKSPEVITQLGEPVVDASWNPSGMLPDEAAANPTANLNYEVAGPKGKGYVITSARRVDGDWAINSLQVTLPDGTQQSLMHLVQVDPKELEKLKFDPNKVQPKTTDVPKDAPPVEIDIPAIDLP